MEIVLTFNDTHHFLGAEQLLQQNNIELQVMSLPSVLGGGCGFCLRLKPEDAPLATTLLSNDSVEYTAYIREKTQKGMNYQPWNP